MPHIPDAEDVAGGRRASDNRRFEKLEQNYADLHRSVLHLESEVALVKAAQAHIKEIFEARFATVEKMLEHSTEKTARILDIVNQWIGEPEKTPAGRTLLAAVQNVATSATAIEARVTASAAELRAELTALTAWKNQADGAISIIRWVGWGAIAMALLAAARGVWEFAKLVTP